MIIEKTTTKKKGKDEYTNNLEQNRIYKNGEILHPYSIIAVTPRGNLVIKHANTIEEIPVTPETRELLEIFTTKTKAGKTSKTTIKGKTNKKEETTTKGE